METKRYAIIVKTVTYKLPLSAIVDTEDDATMNELESLLDENFDLKLLEELPTDSETIEKYVEIKYEDVGK